MPLRGLRTRRGLLAAAVLLAGCGADDKFKAVGPELAVPAPPTSTTSPAPVLTPYAGAGFTISLPGRSEVQSVTTPSAGGPVETTFVTSKPHPGTEYGVTYNSAPYKGAKPIDLDAAARDAAAGAKGTLAGLHAVTYKGHPARDFRIDRAVGQSTVFLRLLLVGRRTIAVTVVLDGEQAAAPDLYRQVLESLTFT